MFLFRICKNYIGVIYMVHCKAIYCQSISIAKKVSYFCSCKSKEEYTIFQTWYNVMTKYKNLHINTQGSYWEWNITVSNLIVYDPVYTKNQRTLWVQWSYLHQQNNENVITSIHLFINIFSHFSYKIDDSKWRQGNGFRKNILNIYFKT